MAHNYSLEFNGLTAQMKQFDEFAKEETMREIREVALQTSFGVMQGGIQYHHGGERTIKYKIRSNKPLHKNGKSTIGIGFIFDNEKYPPKINGRYNPDVAGGIVVQYLMFGTPHLAADKVLYQSLHSKAVRDNANQAGEDAALKMINEIIGGKT